MCPTRWIKRHDALNLLQESLPAIVDALEEISEWQDADTSSNAATLLCAIRTSNFLVCLHVRSSVFAKTLPLCRILQLEKIDLVAALEMVNNVYEEIAKNREKSEDEFSIIFATAVRSAHKIEQEISIP